MTEEIYQTIKSMLEEARGDRYPRLAKLLGPVEPHIKVNYEGSDQVKAGEALSREKSRHDKITRALEWLEDAHSQEVETSEPVPSELEPFPEQESEVSDAFKARIEPGNSLLEHTGDGESGTPAETSGSSSII